MHPFEQQREESEETFAEPTDAARRLATELGINLADVLGTGSGGRVTRDDVEAHAESVPGDSEPAAPGETHPNDQAAEPAAPGPSVPPPVQAEPSSDGCVHFRCPTNPNFNLQSHKLGAPIRFTDGCYGTDDAAEIAALRTCQFVEEVSG